MKKVTNVSLGGRSFMIDEDAMSRLEQYLEHFRSRLSVPQSQQGEVMEEIEGRIADLFFQEVGESGRVVSLPLVEQVAGTLGMPDGNGETAGEAASEEKKPRKLFRDPDEKRIAGVCSGLAYYLDVDVTLVRVLMLAALVAGSAGFWIYLILWIAIPEAATPAQKCEMRGLPATAENIRRYGQTYSK